MIRDWAPWPEALQSPLRGHTRPHEATRGHRNPQSPPLLPRVNNRQDRARAIGPPRFSHLGLTFSALLQSPESDVGSSRPLNSSEKSAMQLPELYFGPSTPSILARSAPQTAIYRTPTVGLILAATPWQSLARLSGCREPPPACAPMALAQAPRRVSLTFGLQTGELARGQVAAGRCHGGILAATRTPNCSKSAISSVQVSCWLLVGSMKHHLSSLPCAGLAKHLVHCHFPLSQPMSQYSDRP